MIANVSPAAIHYEETMNTLNYANRAKNIRVTLKKNILDKEDLNDVNDRNSKGNKGGIGSAIQEKVVNSLKNEILELRKLLNDKNDGIKKKSNSQNKNRELPKNPTDNSTKEALDNIIKLQRIISYHYQEEIKLTKEIIENEKKIASKKVELKEKQIEGVNFPTKKELEDKINNLNKEIGNLYKSNEEKQNLFSKFVKKRSEIQKIISQQNSENSKNILNDYVQYYTLILQNMHLESKKFSDSAEIKIKDLQLNALTSQIKAKDLIIENANNEFKKKFKTDLFNTNIINNKNNYYDNTSNGLNPNINYSNEKNYGKKDNANIDRDLINGLKGHASISKSQNLLKNNLNIESNINNQLNNINVNSSIINQSNLSNNGKDKKNYLQNFKNNLLSSIDNKNSKNNNNILININNNRVNSGLNPKKTESTRNKPSRDLSSVKSEKAVLLVGKSKSPKNKSNSKEKINDVLLNKKSITDKSDISVYMKLNKEMNNNSANKKQGKVNSMKLDQYMDTESAEEYKRNNKY